MNNLFVLAMLTVGIASIAVSAVYSSTILALIGLGLAFWGAILLYVAPTKHVPLTLLNASVSALST
jgi:hypothetical protein